MLHSFLLKIKDHRRRQGRRYSLGHILLFATLALLRGATSYRKVHAFIQGHYATLAEVLGLSWKKVPAYTTIRDIIQGTSSAELEAGFRAYRAELAASESPNRFVNFDGKVGRGSFDHFRYYSVVIPARFRSCVPPSPVGLGTARRESSSGQSGCPTKARFAGHDEPRASLRLSSDEQ